MGCEVLRGQATQPPIVISIRCSLPRIRWIGEQSSNKGSASFDAFGVTASSRVA